MEEFIKELCKYYKISFNKIIQHYNSNIRTGYWIDDIIDYKNKNNKDIIYKEDIPKIFGLIQEEVMEYVMKDAKYYKLDINNLTIKDCYTWYLLRYYISTFLDNEPVDIKIALKD